MRACAILIQQLLRGKLICHKLRPSLRLLPRLKLCECPAGFARFWRAVLQWQCTARDRKVVGSDSGWGTSAEGARDAAPVDYLGPASGVGRPAPQQPPTPRLQPRPCLGANCYAALLHPPFMPLLIVRPAQLRKLEATKLNQQLHKELSDELDKRLKLQGLAIEDLKSAKCDSSELGALRQALMQKAESSGADGWQSGPVPAPAPDPLTSSPTQRCGEENMTFWDSARRGCRLCAMQ